MRYTRYQEIHRHTTAVLLLVLALMLLLILFGARAVGLPL